MTVTGRVAGKVALVTGAARGLGRACALRLAEEGAQLVLLDIGVVSRMESIYHDLGSAADLDLTAQLSRDLGSSVISRFVDVRDGAALGAAVHAACKQFGSIDIAIPAAGVSSNSEAWAITDVQWRTVLDVNLGGVWQTAKAVAPEMMKQRSGSIVLLGSSATHRAESGRAHDMAAKHGVVGLLRSFGRELAPYNVRVNSVDAAEVATEVATSQESLEARVGRRGASVADAAELALTEHPGRLPRPWLEPVDVANAVLFLASDEARCVTGTSIVVDLGTTLAS